MFWIVVIGSGTGPVLGQQRETPLPLNQPPLIQPPLNQPALNQPALNQPALRPASQVQESALQRSRNDGFPNLRLESEPGPTGPTLEVVVLRNGGVFRGNVFENDRYVVVEFENGGEVRLDPDTVDFHANSIEHAYRILYGRMTGGEPRQYLALSKWCADQSLFAESAAQLDLAELAGAEPRWIEQQRRNLAMRMEAEAARRAVIANRSTTPDSTGDQALHESDDHAPVSQVVTEPEPAVDVAARLPEDLRIHFIREVQPRLIHGCAAASCHGPSSAGGFELERVARGRPVTRAMTARNLERVLTLVDTAQPQRSRLLDISGRPHAGSPVAIYAPHSGDHYRIIEDWVLESGEALGRSSPWLATPENREDSRDGPHVVPSIPDLNPNREPIDRRADESIVEGNRQTDDGRMIDSEVMPIGYTEEEEAVTFVPRDAFDPEIFNRYARGELSRKGTSEPVEIEPIPADPIGRPGDSIEPPARDPGANRGS